MASISIHSLLSPSPLHLHLRSQPRPQTLARFSPLRRHSIPLRLPSPLLTALSDDSSTAPVTDIIERDWSFLEPNQSLIHETDRIIAAAGIRPDSKVLTVIPSVGFVGRLVESFPCELLVATHESLLVLATIKENHDSVRCWQGGIDAVPERFGPFDVVFLCYFPALGVSIDQALSYLAARCSEGARLVICCEQGRAIIEQQHREQYSDLVKSVLPHRVCLEKAAPNYSFEVTDFADEPNFYLAVLKFCKARSTAQ
ncbi:S-adenosyl-L-methionine-dependent methyltransferase protein [Dioscorea alata]|uniref:S-adenosyl-L-methionine-dependent methyltransferase protein n=1 Tax=Dioscorea alata TaxID=55571 RepID=A0ACB7U8K1_DIOAL|nr:S-adenosyl-L-methionine-dependent methyltransferase protein [Dioscorea alata]